MESADEPIEIETAQGSEWFRELLGRLDQRSDDMIDGFMAQDPATIDLAGRIGSLPRKVLDVLVTMKEELGPESQAAIDD